MRVWSLVESLQLVSENTYEELLKIEMEKALEELKKTEPELAELLLSEQ